VGKLTWGVSIAAAGAIALGSLAFIRARNSAPSDRPPASTSPDRKLSDASCLADERASRSSFVAPPAAAAEPAPAGVLRGRLQLPWQERKKSFYSYAIYAFTVDGRLEGPKTFTNTDRFELSGLTPGRKAIVFYGLMENLTFPFQIVDLPEKGDVDVVLRPRIPYLLQGRVVDANGAGVGGVYVIAHETMTLPQELYIQGLPAQAAGVEKTSEPVVSPAAPLPEDIVSTYVRIDPLAGRIERGVTTDARGQFHLPVTSPTDPVSVSVERSRSDVLKRETVLPGAAAVRIVVPNQ